MKLRRVNADVLIPKPVSERVPTPRERKRRELESALERVIRDAAADRASAFLVTLEADEKLAAVRFSFNRAKARVGADAVNLVTVGGTLYIAATPVRRGRPRKGS